MSRNQDVTEGIREAFADWLEHRPCTFTDLLEAALTKAFTAWLDANEDEIRRLVASETSQRVAEKVATILLNIPGP